MAKDFLDEIVKGRTAKNPAFKALVRAAEDRRALLKALAMERAKSGRSQTDIAAAMKTSQSQVARIESADCDVRLSTIENMAANLGKRIVWKLVDA